MEIVDVPTIKRLSKETLASHIIGILSRMNYETRHDFENNIKEMDDDTRTVVEEYTHFSEDDLKQSYNQKHFAA